MLKEGVVRFVLVCGLGMLASACATSHYTRSGFRPLPQGVKGKSGAAAALELEGLKLRILGLDEAGKGTPIPRLALRIAFDPRELGYSFDPSQVKVRAKEGASLGPLARAESRYLALAPGSVFDLSFDVTVTDASELELVIAGLARGPRRLEPVTLTLVRRRGQRIERLYWLEAIGTFIAYAPYAR